jgi:virulence factor Mce-like protein
MIGGGVIAAVAVVLLLTRGKDTYDLEFSLANAHGLADGAPVVNGGVNVGTVKLDANRDEVDITLQINKEDGPVGKDVRATIIAQNALGQKQVRVEPGDLSDPAPNDYTIPEDQVATTTDLDQLLATLDTDTRTRLAIVINEVGTAYAGRELDWKAFVHDFAPALSDFGIVIDQLGQDNAALANTLDESDRYVAELATERERLGRMIDNLAGTSVTVAAKRQQLDTLLSNAPATLTALDDFFAELERNVAPLAATSRLLKQTAPSLETTLDRLQPFTTAAKPALKTATAVAPDLERLAGEGGPVLQRSVPMLASLAAASKNEVPGAGKTLDNSVDNLLGTLENWSRAIQFRDNLGHIFRGEATFSPEQLDQVVRRFAGIDPTAPAGTNKGAAGLPIPGLPGVGDTAPKGGGTGNAPTVPGLPALPSIPGLPNLLPNSGGSSSNGNDPVGNLLDFLLGG